MSAYKNISGNLNVTLNNGAGTLAVAGAVTATGNIAGNYFVGNGSLLTGITGGGGGAQGTTGAQGIQGVAGPAGKDGIGWKGYAAGYVDAGAFVTLDNLKFTVTTGGQRGLTVAAVTGTVNLMISGTFGYVSGVGGSATTQAYTYTTTPNMTGSWFGWSFPNQGDGSVYLVNDVTNQRFYRVTLMIGPGYKNNFISIERLY